MILNVCILPYYKVNRCFPCWPTHACTIPGSDNSNNGNDYKNGNNDNKQQWRQQGPSNDKANNDTGGGWAWLIQQRQLWQGNAILPRTLPLHWQPGCNDAFIIIQLFLRGLTLHWNTWKIWNKRKNKSGPGKKTGSGGRPSNPDLSQKTKKRPCII
jgi:hypothetical protein